MRDYDRIRRRRLWAGSAAAAAGVALIMATFMSWMTTPMETGGVTGISGWGTISGGHELVNGLNLNALMEGEGSYRPAVLPAIVGVIALLCGVLLAVSSGYRMADRRTISAISWIGGISGLCCLIWSLWKLIDPGDAIGVLPAGEAHTGAGPVVASLAAALIAAVGAFGAIGELSTPTALFRRAYAPAKRRRPRTANDRQRIGRNGNERG